VAHGEQHRLFESRCPTPPPVRQVFAGGGPPPTLPMPPAVEATSSSSSRQPPPLQSRPAEPAAPLVNPWDGPETLPFQQQMQNPQPQQQPLPRQTQLPPEQQVKVKLRLKLRQPVTRQLVIMALLMCFCPAIGSAATDSPAVAHRREPRPVMPNGHGPMPNGHGPMPQANGYANGQVSTDGPPGHPPVSTDGPPGFLPDASKFFMGEGDWGKIRPGRPPVGGGHHAPNCIATFLGLEVQLAGLLPGPATVATWGPEQQLAAEQARVALLEVARRVVSSCQSRNLKEFREAVKLIGDGCFPGADPYSPEASVARAQIGLWATSAAALDAWGHL
ncbi:unnamed protein product, partial [Polarella glacialis]